METAKELIKRHEGLRLKPYLCSEGRLTIGWGRNLDAKGVSLREAEMLFENDFAEAHAQCASRLVYFSQLSPNRQAALIDMAFQLGIGGLLAFKKALAAIETGDWERAHTELLDSKWAQQTPARAKEVAALILRG